MAYASIKRTRVISFESAGPIKLSPKASPVTRNVPKIRNEREYDFISHTITSVNWGDFRSTDIRKVLSFSYARSCFPSAGPLPALKKKKKKETYFALHLVPFNPVKIYCCEFVK